MRTVKDILNAKTRHFNDVSPATLVIDALKQLDSINLSYLIVMEGDTYKGIFSERDYSRNVILKGRHSDSTTVAEVMTTDVPVVELHQTVEQCMGMIDQYKTRYLVAFDEERLAGIITMHDLLRQVINNKEEVFDKTLAERLVDDDESGRIY